MPLFNMFNRNQASQNNTATNRSSSTSYQNAGRSSNSGYGQSYSNQGGRMGMPQSTMNQNTMNQRALNQYPSNQSMHQGMMQGNNSNALFYPPSSRNNPGQQGMQGSQGMQNSQGMQTSQGMQAGQGMQGGQNRPISNLNFGMPLPDGIRLEPYDPNRYQIPSVVQPAPLPDSSQAPQITQNPQNPDAQPQGAVQFPGTQNMPQQLSNAPQSVPTTITPSQIEQLLNLPQLPQPAQAAQTPHFGQTPQTSQPAQLPQTLQAPQSPQATQASQAPQSAQAVQAPQGLPSGQQSATFPQSAAQTGSSLSQSAKWLGLCIQNERNAKRFYDNLLQHVPQGRQGMLREIINDSLECRGICEEIYKSLNGQNYQAPNELINPIANYDAGINLAIREESKALKDLALAGSEIFDTRFEKKINYLLYKKQANLSLLVYQLYVKEVQRETTIKES